MGIDKVREFLRGFGLDNRIKEFDESSATVELAAKALNIKGALIAKTIGLHVNDRVIVVVCAGDAKISNQKFKEEFGVKPKMIAYDDTEMLLGYKAGGVCPFLLKENVEIYLDVSLERFEYVYPAAGNNRSAVKLTIKELSMLVKAIKWVDVCNIKE